MFRYVEKKEFFFIMTVLLGTGEALLEDLIRSTAVEEANLGTHMCTKFWKFSSFFQFRI
jgi:hypothetical protein